MRAGVRARRVGTLTAPLAFAGLAPVARKLRLLVAAASLVVAGLLATAPASYAAEPLRGEWHLNSFCAGGAPCTEPDSSGNGLGASWVGSPGDEPGRFGRAYNFPSEADYLNAGNQPRLQPANISVVAWVKAASVPTPVKGIVSQGSNGSCSFSSYALYTGGSAPADQGTRFYIHSAAGNFASPRAPDSMWNNQWHMLAGTYDGGTVRLYLDGTEVGSTPAMGSITYNLASHNDFVIGTLKDPACVEQTNFSGSIDEPRVYGRALAPAEIALLADPSAITPPELPADSSPPSSPATPSPSRTRPSASFLQTNLKPKAFAPVTFDASSSRPGDDHLVRYDWDITGDGKADASCGAQTPVFTTNTLSRKVHSVSLNVVDANGSRDSFVQGVSVSRLSLPSRTARAIKDIGATKRLGGSSAVGGLCTPKVPSQTAKVDITANGGPGPGCISQLVYGSFKATGCWRLNNDPASLPQASRIQIDQAMRPVVLGNLKPASGSTPAAIRLDPSRGGAPYGSLLGDPSKLKLRGAHASASMVEYALALVAAVANNTFIADGPVRVNGLDVKPGRSKIAFIGGGMLNGAKAQLLAYGSDVTANSPFGKLPMKSGDLAERFGLTDNNSPLGALKLPKKFTLVPGLGIKGAVSAVMDHYKLKVGANVSLPPTLGSITSRADLTASTENGLELDYFKFSAPQAPLGPVILKNMEFEWRGPEKQLTAGLEATILYEIGAGGRIVFSHGNFQSLRVHAESFPGIVLGPGVHLSALDASYDDNGPVITGGGTLTLGPNPGGGCPKAGVDGTATLDFNWPITLKMVGATKLACFNVATMGAGINEEGYGYFFGRVNPDLSPLPLTLNAAIGGQIQVPINGKSLVFQIDGTASACIDLGGPFKGCLPTADMTVTDRAFAACLDFGPFKAGLRLFYPPPASLANPVVFAAYLIKNFKPLAPGCNVGDYRPFPVKLAKASGKNASAAATSASFTLPAGRRGVLLAVHGEGGPPAMLLHGPGGQTIDVPNHELVHNKSYAAFRLPYDATTYVLLAKPAGGTWRVELKLGSPGIKSVESAGVLPPIKLKARVKRAGHRRELSYRVNTRPGQSVRFVETAGQKDGQFLGTTKKSRGKIRFTPADSRVSGHKIVAYVEQDGAPRDTLTVARFKARLAKIGRAKIRVKRGKRKLTITWKAAKNAQSYRAFINLSDGRRLFFTASTRKRKITVRRVSKRVSGVVTVIGERKGGRLGPKARGRVRAVKSKKRKAK
jgi:hypothetical protein